MPVCGRVSGSRGRVAPVGSLRDMASETFTANWRGWARSSEGYAVRLMGRNDLQYMDELGDLRVFAEPLNKPSTEIVVSTASIPDRPERSREEVVERLRQAFEFRGWTLVEADG